jgi:hypothetical protein
MKKILLVVVLLAFSGIVLSQQTDSRTISKIYLRTEAGIVNHEGGVTDLGIQAIINNKWSVTFSIQHIDMTPKNLPTDYEPGYGALLGIPLTEGEPYILSDVYNLTAGRYFPVGRNFWCTAEAGLSFVKSDKINFQSRPVDTSYTLFGTYLISSNYHITKNKKSVIGGMLRADFNWAFASFMGLGIGAFSNFNSIQSTLGLELKLIFGAMGRKKKNKDY